MIEASFAETAARYQMLPPGSRVLCACSGGPDSTALLHLLCAAPEITVICAHFNHLLRGGESERDEQFVRALCERLGVECVTERCDVRAFASERHMGLEEAARQARYDFLTRASERLGCDRIATAHHAEDNAETVLWNLIRGSGTRGLAGIPPVRGNIVRPLLRATRAEIEDYLARNGLTSVRDSSNLADGNPRNRIRHHVLPLLLAENAEAIAHIGAAAELLRADDAYLTTQAERFMKESVRDGAMSVPEFLALPEPVGARVLRAVLGPLQRRHVDALYALARSASAHAAADLPGGRVRKEYDRLRFAAAAEIGGFRRELAPGATLLPELGMTISLEEVPCDDEIHNSFNTFFFKRDSIRGMMFVDRGRGSDRVRLHGRGCTKTLKKLFQEAKLPPEQRARTPVLFDDDGVLAVYGFGIAERCAAAPGERALRVRITRQAE